MSGYNLITSRQLIVGGFFMHETILLTSSGISRSLTRIAHEIIENNKIYQNIVLLGLFICEVLLAHHLALLIHNIKRVIIPVVALDFRNYPDDIDDGANSSNKESENNVSINISGNIVILVDNVLSTGRSIRAAIVALVHLGRPKRIQLAVLIDCGHREAPIRADYLEKNIPSSRKETIRVKLTDIGNLNSVIIVPYEENQFFRI